MPCRVHICIQCLDSSLIYIQVQFFLQIYCQMFKTIQKYFPWFFCIFTDFCSCVIPFSFHYLQYEGSCVCFHPKVWFWVEEAPTGTLAPLDNLAAQCIQMLKGQVSRYMWVRHLCMASLLSIYFHWGGEPAFHCTIYLSIPFIACLLGSIYSINSVYSHWGACLLDHKA